MPREVDDLVALGRRICEATERIRFDKHNPQHTYAMCLHSRIIELGSAIVALLKSDDISGIPHLARGQLEAIADLRNLASSPDYLEYMEAAHYKEVRRVLRAVTIERRVSDEFARRATSAESASALARADARLAELDAKGVKPLTALQRFQQANLGDEYDSVYAYLCTHTHNNLTALEQRHLAQANGDFEIRAFHATLSLEEAEVVGLSLRVAASSLQFVTSLMEQDAREIEALTSEVDKARRAWVEANSPEEPAA